MTSFEGAGRGSHDREPEVLLLPFAVPESLDLPAQLLAAVEFDPGVLGEHGGLDGLLARRLPDFLHQVLNGFASGGPSGMLEIQSPPGDGPSRWVVLPEAPEPEDVLPMLGGEDSVRALVTGSLRSDGRGLVVELGVHTAPWGFGPDELDIGDPSHGDDSDGLGFTPPDLDFGEPSPGAEPAHVVHAVLDFADPVRGLLRVAEHLATLVGLPPLRQPRRLLSSDPKAFLWFLLGLDGAALIGSDVEMETGTYGEGLLSPFVEALRIDPGFAVSLRALAGAWMSAFESDRVGDAACLRLVDACLELHPTDAEGVVAVAELLTLVDEEDRAVAWLEHAVALERTVPRALECLGVLLANRGEIERARSLWRRGAGEFGEPDFHAHLARLAFVDGEIAEAWRRMLRGLRRMWDRAVRWAEWEPEMRTPSVLLRYLADHVARGDWPDGLRESLVELRGLLFEPQERVDLGVCLAAVGEPDLARDELEAGLAGDLPASVEDRGVRALMGLLVPGFERRFATLTDSVLAGKDPRGALVELQLYLDLRPEFWPALYFVGMALQRLDRSGEALDVMAEVLERRPGQLDALAAMAEMFADRGNAKRALECVEEALAAHPRMADLHLRRARFLELLGRRREADEALDVAIELEPETSAAAAPLRKP